MDAASERYASQSEGDRVEELVIFFSDIEGFSKKAVALSPTALSKVLQEYERIFLGIVESHYGHLLTSMGDRHLCTFHEPLSAVIAAIRIQKSLRRFNRYRQEIDRVVVRIGIHCGPVVRTQRNDLLGAAVALASRLESSARPGSVLISDAVYERVKEFVHLREIRRVVAKNIAEPIRVFEPYEIAQDLPLNLDPLRAEQRGRT